LMVLSGPIVRLLFEHGVFTQLIPQPPRMR
jgi:peptidoglycan biosynthesis protein MviN/MurJ (putative lipid II flippase)